jgi:D-tyrosyl-tRNA(Tyr) deacylase
MKLVIQRVSQARVRVNSEIVGEISRGGLLLLGIAKNDTRRDADFLAKKAVELRFFDDAKGNLNLSALDVGAAFLVVSQFTIYGNCDKGRRPSFDEAAPPKEAEELYEYFLTVLAETGMVVQSGRFAAMMQVELINEGPVTFILESKKT